MEMFEEVQAPEYGLIEGSLGPFNFKFNPGKSIELVYNDLAQSILQEKFKSVESIIEQVKLNLEKTFSVVIKAEPEPALQYLCDQYELERTMNKIFAGFVSDYTFDFNVLSGVVYEPV